MIDSNIIIRYTNALYSTPAEYAPRYDEFRDMFSAGQIKSKEWIIQELIKRDPYISGVSFAIAGAWYGTLGILLNKAFPDVQVNMIDIDPRCKQFIDNMIYDIPASAVTEDMYEYRYKEDYIINTSCEHIPDLREWLNIIPMGRTVILQSNNFVLGAGHINCAHSKEEFIQQTGLSKISYSGELVMPMYTRYMIIGRT